MRIIKSRQQLQSRKQYQKLFTALYFYFSRRYPKLFSDGKVNLNGVMCKVQYRSDNFIFFHFVFFVLQYFLKI